MEEKNLQKLTNKEKSRLKRLLKRAKTPENKMQILIPVIENTAWMKVKLEDARTEIEDENLTCEYDNGGGQKGERENPKMKAYEALWKSYMAGMKTIVDALPEGKAEIAKEIEKPKTALELIRNKHQKEA